MNEKLNAVIDKLAMETQNEKLVWNRITNSTNPATWILETNNWQFVPDLSFFTQNDSQIILLFQTFQTEYFVGICKRNDKNKVTFFEIDGASFYRIKYAIDEKNSNRDKILDDFLDS